MSIQLIPVDPIFTVQVSARILLWPQKCACCGTKDNLEQQRFLSDHETGRANTSGWLIPYCHRCIRHASEYVETLIPQEITSACACQAWAVKYLGYKGSVHTLCFTSESYARSFAEANEKKLIGVPFESRG